MKIPILFVYLVLTGLLVKGQDTLVYKTGVRKVVRFVEIKNNLVFYKLYQEQDGPDFIEMTSDFKMIIRSTGEVLRLSNKEQIYEKDKRFYRMKNMIKVDGLVFYVGVIQVGYERKLSPGINGEIKYGLINGELGILTSSGARGDLIKTGLKIYFPRQPFREQIRSAFTGFYFKPELVYCKYSEEIKNSYKRASIDNYVVNLLAGFQFGLEQFHLDIYSGFGQCWYDISDPYTTSNFSFPKSGYSNLLYDRKFLNAFTFGIAGGIIF